VPKIIFTAGLLTNYELPLMDDHLKMKTSLFKQRVLSSFFAIICLYVVLPAQTYIDNVTTLAGNVSAGYVDGTGSAAKFNQPVDVVVDAAGNVFVADQLNHRIRKITPSGTVSTFAGDGSSGTGDGTGTLAKFDLPTGITIDNAGNLYVADQNSGRIRKITPSAVVTTLAVGLAGPTGLVFDNTTGDLYIAEAGSNRIFVINSGGALSVFAGAGTAGFVNGTALTAQFNHPAGLTLDSIGNLYIADSGNNCIRKITPGGTVSTFAGTGTQGLVNGAALSAQFFTPLGVAFDRTGNLYVTDTDNHTIRMIAPNGTVSNFAGTGTFGSADGIFTSATFAYPYKVTFDTAENFYIADRGNHKVRKISKSFLTTSNKINVACSGQSTGSATITVNGGTPPYTYSWSPAGGTSDIASGLTAGTYTCVITDALSITATATVSITQSATMLNAVVTSSNVNCNGASTGSATLTVSGGTTPYAYLWSTSATTSVITNLNASSYTATVTDAMGCSKTNTVSITQPAGVLVTVSASSNTISPGQISTLTVNASGGTPPYTYTWIPTVNTTTYAVSPTTNTTYTVKVKDTGTCVFTGSTTVGVITNTSVMTSNYVYVSTFVGGSWGAFGDGTGTNAFFNSPRSSVIDASGNLYIADWNNHSIRKVTPAGVVTTLAGTGAAGFANGTGSVAQFNYPSGIAIDASGNLYVADTQNQRIRKITPAGVVSTFAGTAVYGLTNGPSAGAQFANPYGVATDASGNVYVADRDNNCIRKISGGFVTTLAGSGTAGFADGVGASAQFNYPTDVALNSAGEVVVADGGNNRIRKISTGGSVTTVAGSGTFGSLNGVGSAVQFKAPSGITIDNNDNVYVAEPPANFIRKISPVGVVTNITHNGISGSLDGIDTVARFSNPTDVSVDASGTIYVVDNNNHRIRKLSVPLSATVTQVTTDCFPDATGSISLAVSGGAAPYTYSWTPAQVNASTINNLGSGTYSCIISDANGMKHPVAIYVGIDTLCQHIWPGDANSDGMADNLDVLELGLHYAQTGPARASVSNSWQSYFANNWTGTITNGENLNHSDCNGDGIIDDNDTLAIYTNYGLTHAFKGNSQTVTNPQLSIVPDQAAVVKGTWGTASVYLGDAANPINNINGVAFTVNFDNTLIETNSVWIEYPNSFIEASNLHFRKLDFANNNLYTATTHTLNNNVNGNGLIAKLHYQIKSSLTSDQVLNLGLVQAGQSDANGTITPLTSGTATLVAIGSSVGINELSVGNLVSVSPNPAHSIISISSTTALEKVELIDLTGQVLISEPAGEKTHRLNVESLSNGVYFIKAYTGSKQVVLKKLVIQK
jgi:sugar lactone lactonase YvrE